MIYKYLFFPPCTLFAMQALQSFYGLLLKGFGQFPRICGLYTPYTWPKDQRVHNSLPRKVSILLSPPLDFLRILKGIGKVEPHSRWFYCIGMQ